MLPDVVVTFGGEQEDLRVDAVESFLELFLALHADDAIEAEVERLPVELDRPIVLGANDAGVGAGAGRLRGWPAGEPEDRQLRRVADSGERAAQPDPFGALRLGGPRTVDVADVDDHRDPVAFRDCLTEATRAPLCHERIVTTTSTGTRRLIPRWCALSLPSFSDS